MKNRTDEEEPSQDETQFVRSIFPYRNNNFPFCIQRFRLFHFECAAHTELFHHMFHSFLFFFAIYLLKSIFIIFSAF